MSKFFSRFFSRNRQDPRRVRTMADSELEDMKNAPSDSRERKKFDEKSYENSQKSQEKPAPTDQTL